MQPTLAGTLPSARTAASGVYDSANNMLTIYGGMPVTTCGSTLNLTDTWVLSSANAMNGTPQWSALSPGGSLPAGRRNHAAVYDSANNRMIVFGGDPACGSAKLNDVWVLTNANGLGGTPSWTQLSPSNAAPTARDGLFAGYDPASNRMIVYGGFSGSNPALGDVWVLTNANGLGGTPQWIQLTPSGTLPGARAQLYGGYDAKTNRLVIFGGSGACCWSWLRNDAWALTYANGLGGTPQWTQLQPTGTWPAERFNGMGVYDAATNRLFVYGGSTYSGPVNEVWVLSGANGVGPSSWTQLSPTGGPPPVAYTPSLGYDAVNGQMLMFGGSDSAGLDNSYWLLQALGAQNQSPTASAGASQVVECTGNGSALVTLNGSGTDPDGDTLSYTWRDENGNLVGNTAVVNNVAVPLGTHAFTLTVDDGRGATATATVSVTVRDSTPPSLNVSLSPNLIVRRNNKRVKIVAAIQVTDTCDPNPAVKLVSVTVNSKDTDDVVAFPGTDDRVFYVRAETNRGDQPRIYTATYQATDASGNAATASATVVVKRERRHD